jgi:NAD-dependent DNA ligase
MTTFNCDNILSNLLESDNIGDSVSGLSKDNFLSLLKHLEDQYYNYQSIIDDRVYDNLTEIYISKFGPYNSIGAPPIVRKISLPYYLGSLNKIKDDDKLQLWMSKYKGPYLVEDKVDGLTLLIVVKNGDVSLYTRGDGYIGSNITHLMPYLNLPDLNKDISIRGELVLTKESFDKVKGDYKNARNLVSGIVNSKVEKIDSNIAKELSFIAYSILTSENTPLENINILKKLGFNVPNPQYIKSLNINELHDHLNLRIKEAPYEIDGLVIYDDSYHPTINGEDPKHIIAFKGINTSIETKVLSVIWEASRNKLLKPVVIFEPVNLDGVTIKQATGYNARYIIDNNIGPDAIISIVRSGGVIPKITSIITPSPTGPSLPDVNIFGSYILNDSQVDFVLTNPNNDVFAYKLLHFLKVIGIKSFGPTRVKSLVNNNIITIQQLINSTHDQLQNIDGIGSTISVQLLNDINNIISNIPLATIMDASGIFENVGEKTFSLIIRNIPNILNLSTYETGIQTLSTLMQSIKGIGEKKTTNIIQNLPRFNEWLASIPQIHIANSQMSTSNSPKIVQPLNPSPKIIKTLIPQPLIPQPLIPQPLIPQPLIPQPLIPQPLIPQPLMPSPKIVKPLIPQPLMPSPKIVKPLIPQPLIQQPLIDSPKIVKPLIPQPLIDSPKIVKPLIPQPLIPQPLIPQPLIPQPLIPQPLIPQPLMPSPKIVKPLIPQPLIPQPLMPSPKIVKPLIPQPFIDSPKIVQPSSLENKVIVFSGFRDKKLENEIVSRGGRVTTSVSKNTSFVIIKDYSEKDSGKITTAKKLRVPILTLEEFKNRFGL